MLELPAPADGVIVELVKQDGATVTSGDVIAVIDTEAKGAAAAAIAAPKATEPKVPAPAQARAGRTARPPRQRSHRAASGAQDHGRRRVSMRQRSKAPVAADA